MAESILKNAFLRRKTEVASYRCQLEAMGDEGIQHYIEHIESSYINALDKLEKSLQPSGKQDTHQSIDALTAESQQLKQFQESLVYRVERLKEVTANLEAEIDRAIRAKAASRKALQEEELTTLEQRIIEERELAESEYAAKEHALLKLELSSGSKLETYLIETKRVLYPEKEASPVFFAEPEMKENVVEIPAEAPPNLYRRHSLVPRRELRKKTNRMFAKMFFKN